MGRHHRDHDVRIEEEGGKTPSSDRNRRGKKSRSSNDKSNTTKERNSSNKRKRKRREKDDNASYLLGGIIVAAYIAVSVFDYVYYTSQQTNHTKGHQQNDISHRKMEFQSIDKKDEHFIKTGQLPGTRQRHTTVKRKEHTMQQQKKIRGAKPNNIQVKSSSTYMLKELPPISSLINADKITNDAKTSSLLDFSIVGFPKTGTTSLHRHLSDLTISLPKEHCDLATNNTIKLIKDIYNDHEQRMEQKLLQKSSNAMLGESLLRGIKCPQDISSDWSMHNYAKYFPHTKLIIGIRHPVFWFESLYNFRISNVPWKTMLHTSQLTRGCKPGSQGVCAWRANFHDFLARLGKTSLSSSELKLLSLNLKPVTSKVGPIFIYELTQLSDKRFRKDLKDFLGLTKDIPPIPQIDTSGRFDHLPSVKQQTSNKKIDICDSEHDAIRLVLMEKAKRISTWMRQYFIKSDEVFVSNRPYFESMLKSWMWDPCG